MFGRAEVLDRISDPYVAAADHIRVETTPVDQPAQHARCGQLLQMAAWVAELGDDRFDLTDADAAADQVVERDAARHHVAANLVRGQLYPGVGAQPLDRLCLEQRDVAVAVAVALDAASGDDLDLLRRVERGRVDGAPEDPLDHAGHRQMMPCSRAPSTVSAR